VKCSQEVESEPFTTTVLNHVLPPSILSHLYTHFVLDSSWSYTDLYHSYTNVWSHTISG